MDRRAGLLLAAVVAAACAAPAAAALPPKDALLAEAVKAFDYYVAKRTNGTHPACDWEYGTFMVGSRELEHALRARGAAPIAAKAAAARGAGAKAAAQAREPLSYASDIARLNAWARSFGDKYNWDFCGANVLNADNQVGGRGGGAAHGQHRALGRHEAAAAAPAPRPHPTPHPAPHPTPPDLRRDVRRPLPRRAPHRPQRLVARRRDAPLRRRARCAAQRGALELVRRTVHGDQRVGAPRRRDGRGQGGWAVGRCRSGARGRAGGRRTIALQRLTVPSPRQPLPNSLSHSPRLHPHKTPSSPKQYYDRMLSNFNYSVGPSGYGFWSPEDRLFYRDPPARGAPPRVYWSRGNGWVMGALVAAIEFSRPDDPRRAVYVDYFKQHAARLRGLQGESGCWHVSLTAPEFNPTPETSGTALFTHGMAWGVRAGLLDAAEYAPTLERAWRCLSKTSLQPGGLVGYCQPVGYEPGRNVRQDSTSSFCTGQFIMAASSLSRIAPEAAPAEGAAGALAARRAGGGKRRG
jgi:opacity protein-like surface antigen